MCKRTYIIALLCTAIAQLSSDPLLVVTIMVKNESAVICQTLQPYVDEGLQHFVVYDTGSEDDTPQIARTLFEQQSVAHGYVIEEPFVDFATSRNRALELTYEKFPDAPFVLMIDAEWYIHNVSELVAFCHAHEHDTEAVYLLRMVLADATMYTGRLLRCAARAQFIHLTHECLDRAASVRVPDSVYFEYKPTEKGFERTQQRWHRDLKLLQQELADNPQDTRTLFYLAQTLAALEQLHEAYQYYTACCASGIRTEPNELIYLAHYRLGKIAEQLMENDGSFNWQTAMHHYLAAFSYNQHRAEPLIAIAQHYWDTREIDLCFLFARHAAELPYPPDYFCVEHEVYAYTRYNLLGASAGPLGYLELGTWAVKKALEYAANAPHLLRNLAEYERLAQ